MTTDGLTRIASAFGANETMDRLEAAVSAKGMTVFARIDHAAGAAEAGLPLRPTQVLIFGNAKGGTPLMQDAQTAGLDLPLRALAWEDADGRVWLTATDAHALAARHGLGQASAAAVEALAAGVDRQLRAAVA